MLRLQSGLAAGPNRGGDLLVDRIAHIPGGPHPFDAGPLVGVGHDVAVVIQLQLAAQKVGVGHIADGDEHPFGGEQAFFAGFDVAHPEAGDHLITLDLGHDRIPQEFDLFILECLLLENRLGAELIAAVDDGHFAGIAGQEQGLLHGGVAAADHDDLAPGVEKAVAGGAIGHPPPGKFLLAGHVQFARRGAAGDDEGHCFQIAAVGRDLEGVGGKVHAGHDVHFDARPESLGLLLHPLGQFRPGHILREAGVVADFTADGHLPAQGRTGDDQGVQLRPRRIDRRSVAGRAAADDDYLFHLVSLVSDFLEWSYCTLFCGL